MKAPGVPGVGIRTTRTKKQAEARERVERIPRSPLLPVGAGAGAGTLRSAGRVGIGSWRSREPAAAVGILPVVGPGRVAGRQKERAAANGEKGRTGKHPDRQANRGKYKEIDTERERDTGRKGGRRGQGGFVDNDVDTQTNALTSYPWC